MQKRRYKFDSFHIDVERQILSRDGETVPVTPKVFAVLVALIENASEVVTKSTLMEKVWPDSYVEEGNLKFSVNQLRKALGEDLSDPKYIETVRGRGYRFIARVESIEAANGEKGERAVPGKGRSRLLWIIPVLAAAMLISTTMVFIGSRTAVGIPHIPIFNSPPNAKKLTTDGESALAVISNDASFVVFSHGLHLPKQSIWLRDLNTEENRVLIQPDNFKYFGMKLSPDDKTLYFIREAEIPGDRCLMKVPVSGGIPETILCRKVLHGWFDVSRDGGVISFNQCNYKQDDYCSLKVINADGSGEKNIYTSSMPTRIADNAFSPDGRYIAFAAGQSIDGSDNFALYQAETENGAITELTKERFFNIQALRWMSGGETLLIISSKSSEASSYFSSVNRKTGEVAAYRSLPDTFVNFNMNGDFSKLVASTSSADFRIHLYSGEGFRQKADLGNANSIQFMPDGKLLLSSEASAKHDIWVMETDGTNKRQLTNDPALAGHPVADLKRIYFSSNRTGQMHVWSMAHDGSEVKQLTKDIGGLPLGVSNDGQWVYYRPALKPGNLRRVSVADGTEESTAIPARRGHLSFMPDGSKFINSDRSNIFISSAETGENIRKIALPKGMWSDGEPVWNIEGTNLYMILGETFAEMPDQCSVWRHSVAAGSMDRLFDLSNCPGERDGLTVSPDERHIAILIGRFQRNIVLINGLK